MSPRKLTDATKKEILKLYRETEATTSTLAERYGVSSSTISRFLKNFLSEMEYEELIQQKRLARTPRSSADDMEAIDDPEPFAVVSPPAILSVSSPSPSPVVSLVMPPPQQLTLPVEMPLDRPVEGDSPLDASTLQEFFEEEIGELDEEDEEDWDDEDEEDEEDDEEDDDFDARDRPQSLPKTTQLQVFPLSSAAFPQTCYLVIDRSAELITRPLKDFAELGKVPSQEIQQRTLPIFDSHRVARRFSKRRERVIKVPDGRMIEKAQSHLEAKGITRLLMDGRIYSLSPV
jgi:hypothetical protein